MFSNYLKITVRNILRNKFYSSINIIGLSIGIICTILIMLFVSDELSYDKHNLNYKSIYRLESDYFISGKNDRFAITSVPLAPTLKTEFPEIEEMARFIPIGDVLVNYGDREFYESDIYIADSTVFDIFTHSFIAGDPAKALTKPYSIVLSQSLADKYFGNENPIGKTITTNKENDYTVTGVMGDMPKNSHLRYEALISATTIAEQIGVDRFNDNSSASFWNINVYSFVLLNPNSSIQTVLDKSDIFYDKYMRELGDQINAGFTLMASNLADNHFRQGLQYERPTGNIVYVYIFIIVAVFILLVACINYMNMATARSAKRAREVGIRKVVGAYKTQLVRQFLSESIILAVIALVIALIAVQLIMPVFNNLSGKELQFGFDSDPNIYLGIIFTTLIVGLLSGSYPAFFLSSYRPVVVLKGTTGLKGSSGLLRKILVVIQFSISIIMIVGTLVVRGQLDYFQNKDLGFDKEDIMIVGIPDTTFAANMNSFEEELVKHSNILGVTTSTSVPGGGYGKVVFRVDENGELVEKALNFFFTDYDYLDIMDIDLVDGRYYDPEFGTDITEAFVINQTAVEHLGWSDEPLGKRMQFGIQLDGTANRDGRVIGVVKDFNFGSLHNEIEPLAILLRDEANPQISIKMSSNDIESTIGYVSETWSKFDQSRPFEYDFLEDRLDELYTAEEKIGTIFGYFSFLTIIIASMGLFGLSTFISEQRTKEIGIRKVLGATVQNLVFILSKDFLYLVMIANVIAWPIAWWGLNNWLQNFPYHDNLGLGVFILAGLIGALIALVTVSSQAVKAALANPITAIKYE